MTRWFLPHDADLMQMLRHQAEITVEGLDALVDWSRGTPGADETVRSCEHRADGAKRDLWRALREAFSPPMDSEDLFTLSTDLDEILNGAKDLVREMEVMGLAPDDASVRIACELRSAVQCLADACTAFGSNEDDPTGHADAAIHHQRNVEREYRAAMSALLSVESVHEIVARREGYRRMSRMADLVHRVADRVWYATVKEA
jgi:uncharacterized protein Yka (UPF0111/DUF47 family)